LPIEVADVCLDGTVIRQDAAGELERTEGRHGGKTPKQRPYTITQEQTFALVDIAKDRWLEQLEARLKPLPEHDHLKWLDADHPDDAGHLRAFALRFKAFLPERVDAARAFAKSLEAFDELVRRCEAALTVWLSLAGGLLIALVYRTPLAGAGDVHAFLDAELIAATCTHAPCARWLLAISRVANANPCARSFAIVDVVATITAAHRLEHPRATAVRHAWDAPMPAGLGGEEAPRILAVLASLPG
jgi:hypothetical protein